jgi:hypothetical protein
MGSGLCGITRLASWSGSIRPGSLIGQSDDWDRRLLVHTGFSGGSVRLKPDLRVGSGLITLGRDGRLNCVAFPLRLFAGHTLLETQQAD